MRTRLLLALLLAGATPAAPQTLQRPRLLPEPAGEDGSLARTVAAARISGTAPSIDGRLDDAIWATAPVATDFVQTRPRPGEPPSYQTEIRVLYDANAVYVGARMYDAHPDSIVAQLTRRDQAGIADAIEVAIDSYHDHRTAYLFRLNSRGVMADALVFDFDSEADMSLAQRDTVNFCQYLAFVHEVPRDALRIAFSGCKGFHVALPFELVTENAEPFPAFWQAYRETALELAGEFGTADASIYELRRLFRLLNTVNSKSGLFKIPLSFEELSTLAPEAIPELERIASRPGGLPALTLRIKADYYGCPAL